MNREQKLKAIVGASIIYNEDGIFDGVDSGKARKYAQELVAKLLELFNEEFSE